MIRVAAAIDSKRGLATDEGIPWDLPTDRVHLRQLTNGGNLLMGYGTYLDFKSATNDRNWFVLTTKSHRLKDGFRPVNDLKGFMKSPPENLWLFGGANVFAQTLGYADELELTRVEGDFRCTKFFPEFEDDFKLTEKSKIFTENGINFHYEVWKRKS